MENLSLFPKSRFLLPMMLCNLLPQFPHHPYKRMAAVFTPSPVISDHHMMPSSKLGRAWLTAQQLSSASLSHQMHFQEISYLLMVTKAFEYIQNGHLHSARDGWCTGGSRDTNRKERETGLPAHLGEELGLLTSVARQMQVKAK